MSDWVSVEGAFQGRRERRKRRRRRKESHGARRRAAHMHGWEMSFKCLAVKVRVPV